MVFRPSAPNDIDEHLARGEGHTHYVTGTYGTLYYNQASGDWTYLVDADAVDALTSDTTDIFKILVEDSGGGQPGNFPTTMTITLNGATEHTTFMAGLTGARAAAFVNGIEFRALTTGEGPNNWAVSFAPPAVLMYRPAQT